MTAEQQSWQSVQEEVLRRIHEREWKPGDLIPGEAALAEEFGCARATVNRALRELAGAGLLDRRRKAGTRVALNPVRKATLDIPVTRLEIERRGAAYGYALIETATKEPPVSARAALGPEAAPELLHVRCVHLADGKPYAYEDRWIDPASAPGVRDVDLARVSANEWLVRNAPFTRGDVAFSAESADASDAEALGVPQGAALLVLRRTTWAGDRPITSVRLAYAPGHAIRTTI